MTEQILHVGRPNIGDREVLLERIGGMLDRRWLSNDGPLVKEFEQRIAKFVDVEHCITMCNATVALEIAYRAVGFHSQVIVPSYTFVATAHALEWQGIKPIFADVDPASHNIDPNAIEKLLSPSITGIVGVHLWGRACDTAAIQDIASRRGIPVVYDAAHAFGCSTNGRMIGGFGTCEVFSFHATKFITSFEGGAIVTNDGELADRLRLMRNFGFRGLDNVGYLGVNGKMPEVCAAMGLTSLDAIDAVVAANVRNYRQYRERLSSLRGLSVISYDETQRNNWQYVVVEVDPTSPVTRDVLIERLHSHGVIARKYFWPGCHRMEPYLTNQPDAGQNLSNTEALSSRVIVLPTGQAVSDHDVARVCSIVESAWDSDGA